MSEHVNDTELLRASLFGLPKPTPRLRLHQVSLRGDRPDFLDRLREAFRDESASYAAFDALMHVDYATIDLAGVRESVTRHYTAHRYTSASERDTIYVVLHVLDLDFNGKSLQRPYRVPLAREILTALGWADGWRQEA